jgi:hypothetical protein
LPAPPNQPCEPASVSLPDASDDDLRAKKKRKKSKHRSDAVQIEQRRQTAEASAALPAPALPPSPAAPSKEAQKAKLPVQPSKPPKKRLARPPSGPSFLEELEAIAAAPRDPSAVPGRPVDIGDFFKFELQQPRVKRKPANTAHKVKNPTLLPAAAPVDADSYATARRELLMDSHSRHAELAKKAALLGFTLQSGAYSVTEDKAIGDTIRAISQSRGISEEELVQMIMNTSSGGQLHDDERSHITKEWRNYTAANLNRTVQSVARRVRVIHDIPEHSGALKTAEVVCLKELVAEWGTNWKVIGGILGRSGSVLSVLWKRITEVPDKKTGRWAEDEIARLWLAYDRRDPSADRLAWTEIARHVATRDSKQCRQHV